MEQRARGAPLIGPLFLIAVALALLGWVGWRLVESIHLARTATAAPGVILDAGLEERASWRPLGRRVVRQVPWVHYAYEVDGIEYEGSGLTPFWISSLRSSAYQESLVAGMEPGREVVVWVDPANPARSWLSLELDPWLAASLVCLGATLLAVGVAAGAVSVARRRGHHPQSISLRRWLGLFGLGVACGLLLAGGRFTVLGDPPWVVLLGLGLALAASLLLRSRRTAPA